MLVLDFETYYDTEYSLRRMTTLEYVADPRFKAHMLGYKWISNTRPDWTPESGVLLPDEIAPFLARVDWTNTPVIGHNLFFDAAILRWRYGVTTCRQWFDTLGMARYVIGAKIPSLSLGGVYAHLTGGTGKQKYAALNDMKGVRDLCAPENAGLYAQGAAYCTDDVSETEVVFRGLVGKFPVSEWAKMHWCIDMWLNPKLTLDKAILEQVVLDEQAKKIDLVARTGLSRTGISSNQQFAAHLETLGVIVPTKISKTTGKKAYALAKNDQDFDELRGHDDVRVRDAVEARLAVKSTIEETRAARMIKMGEITSGWLPVPLNYCGASQTGRLSGGEKVNLQNMGRGSKLRDAIVAPEDYVVLAADLSNIELRINMAVCGDTASVEALRQGKDLYCEFAGTMYGRAITKADKLERMLGKVAELSLGYSASAPVFKQMVWVMGNGHVISLDEASRIVQTYRTKHIAVAAMWQSLTHYAATIAAGAVHAPGIGWTPETSAPVKFERDGILMPSGFKIKYPDIRTERVMQMQPDGTSIPKMKIGYTRYGGASKGSGFSFIHGGLCLENMCQALAAEVLWDMIVRIAGRYSLWPALQVHDEIVYVIPEDRAEEIKAGVLDIMHRPPNWWLSLPVAAEAAYGRSYGEAK